MGMYSRHTLPASRHLLDRRGFLGNSVQALSGIACAALLAQQGLLRAADEPLGTVSGRAPIRPQIDAAHPFADRPAHQPAVARRVLVIFCSGACSHLDTFDYKPELWRRHGQPMPGGEKLVTFQGEQGNLTRSPWQFRPRGQSGKMISDLLPHLGSLADQLFETSNQFADVSKIGVLCDPGFTLTSQLGDHRVIHIGRLAILGPGNPVEFQCIIQ
ncbi:hypothetical protein E3A20_20760 [Planctomyces bekefii]|uniref:DUF1501 domain-containing protein n=1 Tax=Planctomyces bekefii TaxID=1653850 RepID=A0A5C6M6I5_9PLAN|nr:hypothetical protein E3A20_20760 [Planctomyces bekefii]